MAETAKQELSNLKLVSQKIKSYVDNLDSNNAKLSKSNAFTGATNTFKEVSATQISTGTDTSNYFQSRKFRGEGDATTYYHAIDFGYANHNQVDFYEYGGVYNFWQNTTATATSDSADRVASFQLGKLVERGNTLTYPGKSGTLATTDDVSSVKSSLQTTIDNEVSARKSVDANLQTQIDKIKTFPDYPDFDKEVLYVLGLRPNANNDGYELGWVTSAESTYIDFVDSNAVQVASSSDERIVLSKE